MTWGRLYGCARGLAIANAAAAAGGLSVIIAADTHSARQLEAELQFFNPGQADKVLIFPDWETLPYDVFSPHEDIVSTRLETLYRLPTLGSGVLIVPVTTLMQRLAPRTFLDQNSLMLAQGQRLEREAMRRRLEDSGYTYVSQVMAHGEFAVRGSIIDLFPMGSELPYRIDLFDDDIESIRTFDPENQRSLDKVDRIRLLPAREFPIDETAIKRFRQAYRAAFEGDPNASPVYRDVSNGLAPAGIEYYAPLFFERTQTLFDYLPDNTLFVQTDDALAAAAAFETDINTRYEQRRHDIERPLLPPERLFLSAEQIGERIGQNRAIRVQRFEIEQADGSSEFNFDTGALPNVSIHARAQNPAESLQRFSDSHGGRTLFVAESAGRREYLIDTLRAVNFKPAPIENWDAFADGEARTNIAVAPLDSGAVLRAEGIAIITEDQLFGERAQQSRRRQAPTRDADAIIANLTDLNDDSPVVHEDHGVGRYRGLSVLTVGSMEGEYLTLEYAGGDKLYVPVASLHLVSRYTGADPEHAPLHRLGGEQWKKIKQRAAKKAYDVAAELLDIHARRAVRQGFSFDIDNDEHAAFAATFPFEETPDQLKVIEEVLADMRASQPMDRVVCGDVGFGKTEVAMRAAFVAAQSGKQIAILVPTTLLAQQHYQTFSDRFADWPVSIEALSRFRTQQQQKTILSQLAEGKVDIVIGTHKLIQADVAFKNLGLVIVDEEHRFGVRHKERFKALRSEVDMLTLTATPIPRTLNMSLSGLRDLSLIATPPLHRHTIKTFVSQWNDAMIAEACQREIKRGGQVYFLHNEVKNIERIANNLGKLLPGATIRIAHGQMRERKLERVMLDFYHQRFNILVCTTIIESGIDVPNANTIVINRADKLGMAQLHQIRGRVGRSHHRAYAYLLAPPAGAMTADAKKRLEAVESLEDLGVGFTLATHDLEIRGAGELLGDEQSGQIQEIGFTLYNHLLESAVRALRAGELPDANVPLVPHSEVDLGVPILLPEDYVPDVPMRLILYKRIASAEHLEALRALQVEMIDRFGLLPEPAMNLFAATRVKLAVNPFGVTKVEAHEEQGRILFGKNPRIDPHKVVELVQSDPQTYKLDNGNRLRFSKTMESVDDRVDTVLNLLNSLALQQAA